MIKYIIKAIKALQEQQKQQRQLNVLIKNPKSESVKIRIPKKYINTIELFIKYGLTEPETIEIFIKTVFVNKLAKGFPTQTKDITGKQILVGSIVTYDFEDNTSYFRVVYENNAFRKEYPNWDQELEKPLLEYGKRAEKMRLKIFQS
jgi:hypothetical protein